MLSTVPTDSSLSLRKATELLEALFTGFAVIVVKWHAPEKSSLSFKLTLVLLKRAPVRD
jgi:hypothetical protein